MAYYKMKESVKQLADSYRDRELRSTVIGSLLCGSPHAKPRLPIPAVYTIRDQDDKVIYVGRTNDIERRMYEHVNDEWHSIWRHGATHVRYAMVFDKEERKKVEKTLIEWYDPVCNRRPKGHTLSSLVPGKGLASLGPLMVSRPRE